jgi:hypothetical protein
MSTDAGLKPVLRYDIKKWSRFGLRLRVNPFNRQR